MPSYCSYSEHMPQIWYNNNQTYFPSFCLCNGLSALKSLFRSDRHNTWHPAYPTGLSGLYLKGYNNNSWNRNPIRHGMPPNSFPPSAPHPLHILPESPLWEGRSESVFEILPTVWVLWILPLLQIGQLCRPSNFPLHLFCFPFLPFPYLQ